MNRSKVVLLNALIRRTNRSLTVGGDGYVSTGTLSFDAGINTRSIRKILDHAVCAGEVARRDNGPGKPFSYRAVEGVPKC